MKILIMRLHSLPHILSAMHVVNVIADSYPESEIHFVTSPKFQEYVSRNPKIHKVHTLSGDIAPLVFELLKLKLDILVDLQGDARTFYVRTYLAQQYNAQLQIVKYPSRFWQRWLGGGNKLKASITSGMLDACKQLSLKPSAKQWQWFAVESEHLKKDDLPTSHSAGYYTIEVTKRDNVEVISKIIASSKLPVVLIGTENAWDIAEQLKQVDPFKIYNSCGKYSIGEQVQLLSLSRANICTTAEHGSLAITTGKPMLISATAGRIMQDLAVAKQKMTLYAKYQDSAIDFLGAQ